ncbi:hypothetical protein TWF281_002486 [Arthrobotrys megalospora]
MHIASTAVALAILNFVSPISGHCVFLGAIGDRPGAANGQALGVSTQTHVNWGGKKVGFRSNDKQWPFQMDTTVFASPVVPWTKPGCWDKKCCKKASKKNPYPCFNQAYYTPVKRIIWTNGCGATIQGIANDASKRHSQAWTANPAAKRNVLWFQRPVPAGAITSVQTEIGRCIGMKKLTTASANGWLKIKVHQLNADGGGPFRCRVDQTGTANGPWTWLTVAKNIPGNKFSVNKYRLKRWEMLVKLPKTLDCTGSVNGHQNICVVRCENNARNGPFGGCIPFQQWKPPVPQPQPTPVPEPEVEEVPPEAEEEEVPEDYAPVEDDEGSDYDGY